MDDTTLQTLFSTIAQALGAAIGVLAAFALFHIQQLHLGLHGAAQALLGALRDHVDAGTRHTLKAHLETGQFSEVYEVTRAIVHKSGSQAGEFESPDHAYLSAVAACPVLPEDQRDEVVNEFIPFRYLLFARHKLVQAIRLSLILTLFTVFYTIAMIPLVPLLVNNAWGMTAGILSIVLTFATLVSFYRSVAALLLRDHPHRT